MTTAEGILILVTLITGPVAAVQAQMWIERRQSKRKGKDYIFRTLMATRAARISAEHVQALNMIDLEFYGGGARNKRVREAWKAYLDHLNLQYDKDHAAATEMKRDELFVDLLYQMALCLGFDFDKTHIKNSTYSPVAHGNLELEQNVIRLGLVNILTGKSAFPIAAQTSDEEAKEQALLRRLLTAYLSNTNPIPVRIVGDSTGGS